jgi:hypothetical protein
MSAAKPGSLSADRETLRPLNEAHVIVEALDSSSIDESAADDR